MDSGLDIATLVLLALGSFFCLSGGIGMLRFPDFYTRMHAAGVTDTLGAALVIAGLMVQATPVVFLKLVLILLFLLLTSPTSSHALAKAAVHGGLKPWFRQD